MKKIFTAFLIMLFVGSASYLTSENYGKSCSPKGKCTACKNCTGCKNCAKNGGTCSVCK